MLERQLIETDDPAYNCGRLLAILDDIQYAAQGDVGADVVARFYGNASTFPRNVFPRLLRLEKHHRSKLSKDQKRRHIGIALGRKLDDVFALFPNLAERQHNPAGVLSGGEQQMLTMCRTLMGDPDLVIIDEPTEGLAPKLVEQVARLLDEIARRGISILLVEQKLTIALKISKRLYVMGHGRIVFEGTPAELGADAAIRKEWLEV